MRLSQNKGNEQQAAENICFFSSFFLVFDALQEDLLLKPLPRLCPTNLCNGWLKQKFARPTALGVVFCRVCYEMKFSSWPMELTSFDQLR